MEFLLLSGNGVNDALYNIENGLNSANNSAFSLYGIFAALAGIFGIGVWAFGIICAIVSSVFAFLFMILEYLLPAIALFKMAKRAGYKYPWLAFIPIAQTYLEFVLPRREFNLLVKTKKRNYMAMVFLILTYFGTSIIIALNVVPALGQLLDLALPIVLMAMAWRKRYDMLVTFRDKELAIPISIISIIFPWVYSIVLIISMGREPEYGAGNYYNIYMEDH
ncbi:MAG: hypothetical protein II399_05030 [Lachnospiraceae bacterium]|nr:hypothetical protein [Lachnospiraceae bacterium]